MSKRFRCGRIMLTKNGTIKKLGLNQGGGSRFCELDDYRMTFDDVRDRLVNLFNLGDTEYQISLCDYQFQPLDLNRYNTVLQYIQNNGFNPNSTVLYLCTKENADDNQQSKQISNKENNKTPVASATSIEYKPIVKNEPMERLEQQVNPFEISLSRRPLDYSFTNTSIDLVKRVRQLINPNNFDKSLIQLFEYICIIHGYVCSTISSTQDNQDFQTKLANRTEFMMNLNNMINISQSIETLIKANKEKFDQYQNFSMIYNSYIEFDQNLKIFQKQWSDRLKNMNHTGENSTYANVSSTTQSRTQTTSRRSNDEVHSLFQPLLNLVTEFLESMDTSRLHAYRTAIKYLITDLESIRSNVNFYDNESLWDAKQAITSIKIRYTRKFKDKIFNSSRYQFTNSMREIHKKILRKLSELITFLQPHPSRQYESNPSNNSNSSSSSISTVRQQQQFKNDPSNPPKRMKSEHSYGINSGQMDVAVYSSTNI